MSKEMIAENSQNESEIGSNQLENSTSNKSEQKEDSPIKILLSEMGDHHEFTLFNNIHLPLPIILYDNGDLHTYFSLKSMEDAGLYTMHKHHIVSTDGHQAPALDLSITNLVAFQFIAAIFIMSILFTVARKYKKNMLKAPTGILQNLVESAILFVRDDIVRTSISKRETADRLTPYFLTLFFFLYVSNMTGLMPGGHSPTGSFTVTLAMALISFIVINYTALKEEGIGHYLSHLTAGTHWSLWILIIPIEIMGMFIKPGVLALRLFANMTAGHIVIFALIGIIFIFKSYALGAPITGFILFIYLLELLVAFLQAYIFTMLTSIFVGLNLSHSEAH